MPTCRCTLTEALVSRLRTDVEGAFLASDIAGMSRSGQAQPVIGSDLEPISPVTCTNQRKRESYLPQFRSILLNFNLDAAIPTEA